MGRVDPSQYNLFLVLITLCAVVGIVVAFRLQRENDEESGVITDKDRLEEFERAYFEGEMSREEFDRVKQAFGLSSGPPRPRPSVEEPAPPSQVEDPL